MTHNRPRIGIDIRLWSHPGMGRYLRELVYAMAARRGHESFVFFGYKKDLAALPESWKAAHSRREVCSPIYSVYEQAEMASKTANVPLLHVPHFNIPVFRRSALAVTVHDLIYLHDAKASKSRWGKPCVEFLFRQIQKKSAAVFVVSEYTKNDLLNYFPGIAPDRVTVTHEAASPLFQPLDEPAQNEATRRRHGLKEPYVLFVGSLKEHKNIPTLIRAVQSVREEKKLDTELVIVGRRDPKNKALSEEIAKNAPFVRYLGELPDEELVRLYNAAGVFVLPSFREGFGLPVLEAMACGTPVIVSDRTSLPEIAGDAGLIFRADRVDELAGLLYNVLTGDALRKSLVMKGFLRADQFSWKKTAEKTLDVYDRLLK